MVDIAIKNAVAYAARHELRLGARLGFGIHGSVHVVEHKIEDLGIYLVDVSPSNIAFLD